MRMTAVFAPPHYQVQMMPMCTREQLIVVDGTAPSFRFPRVVQGPELTSVEYIALLKKLNLGTQDAARFLQSRGWDVEDAVALLVLRGRNIH